MSLSGPFILRPVATSLLMAAVLLVGILAYTQLPISALPQVDYPTIQVLTFYPGASPRVMATTVTAPLEQSCLDQAVEASGQHIGGDAEAVLEVIEARETLESIAQNEDAPPLADTFEGARHRTFHAE